MTKKQRVINNVKTGNRDRAEAGYLKQRDSIPHPKTFNQLYLGDPYEGRSALDKKVRGDR